MGANDLACCRPVAIRHAVAMNKLLSKMSVMLAQVSSTHDM